MKHQNEHQKLKSLVRDLERELSQEKTQLEALGETQERLQQAERICHELSDENRRLREEINEWQKRLAASEDNQKETSSLKHQLNALQMEHDALVQENRRIQEQLNLQRPSDNMMAGQSPENSVAVLPSEPTASDAAIGHKLVGDQPADPTKETKFGRLLPNLIVQKWRYAAIFASIVIAIAVAGMSIKALRTESPSSTSPAPMETAAVEEPKTPVSSPRPSVAPAPRVRGTFQTLRPTQVFSEPSEDSALVASIDKGVRLNVVDSREGWLEIRSKHGRPPGFIRREEAVRISSN